MKIDFDGFEQRVVELPIRAGNYGEPGLGRRQATVHLLCLPAGARESRSGGPSGNLLYYDLKEREEKTVMEGIDSYTSRPMARKIGYKSRSTYGIVDVGANKKSGDGKVASGDLKAWINPREEWQQIFNEAWRIQRDFFYDPYMHGVDWDAMKERYGALLPYVVDREDLNYVIGEMIAEMNASHAYIGGGDMEGPDRLNVGLLGCDFELDAGQRCCIASARSMRPASGTPSRGRHCKAPGLDVQEGDYLHAVNGRPLDTSLKTPGRPFRVWRAGRDAGSIGRTPDVNDANDILIKPMSSESQLRNTAPGSRPIARKWKRRRRAGSGISTSRIRAPTARTNSSGSSIRSGTRRG